MRRRKKQIMVLCTSKKFRTGNRPRWAQYGVTFYKDKMCCICFCNKSATVKHQCIISRLRNLHSILRQLLNSHQIATMDVCQNNSVGRKSANGRSDNRYPMHETYDRVYLPHSTIPIQCYIALDLWADLLVSQKLMIE